MHVQELKHGWKVSGVMRPRWFISAESSIPQRVQANINLRVGLWQLFHFILMACQLKATSKAWKKSELVQVSEPIFGDETTISHCILKLFSKTLPWCFKRWFAALNEEIITFVWCKDLLGEHTSPDRHLKGRIGGKQAETKDKEEDGAIDRVPERQTQQVVC